MLTYIVKNDVGDAVSRCGLLSGMDLAARLRFARKRAELTQGDVADRFGIARVSVTQWEGGTSRPDPDKFVILAELFSVPLMWLMDGSGPEPDTPGAQSKEQLPSVVKRPSPRKIYLKEWREHTESSIAELARAINRDHDYYEYLETYPYKVSIENLDIFAKKMGVVFDQLWFPPPPKAKSPTSIPVQSSPRKIRLRRK